MMMHDSNLTGVPQTQPTYYENPQIYGFQPNAYVSTNGYVAQPAPQYSYYYPATNSPVMTMPEYNNYPQYTDEMYSYNTMQDSSIARAKRTYIIALIIITLMDIFGYSFLTFGNPWFAFSYAGIIIVTFLSVVGIRSRFLLVTLCVFRVLYVLYLLGYGSYLTIEIIMYTGSAFVGIIFYTSVFIYLAFTIVYIVASLRICSHLHNEQQQQQSGDVQYSVVDMDVYNNTVQSV